MKLQKGLIHRIERFSLHDGPGIRTLVVMKGCPLRCRWCSSPHTQKPAPEILYISSRCRGCGKCIRACKNNAITMTQSNAQVQTDRTLCSACGDCIVACMNGARELSGKYFAPEELLHEVEKDSAFYRRSGGGITVGGGEPAMQLQFTVDFLSLCRAHAFHTAMETSAFTSWERLALILPLLDIVYVDLKHADSAAHKAWTGVPNEIIIENIKRTAHKRHLIIRIPVIPGFNDSPENISATADLAKTLGGNLLRLELLPYHKYGIHKYEELDRVYAAEFLNPPTEKHMAELKDLARRSGIDVETGS